MKNVKQLERFGPDTKIFGDIARIKIILKNGGEVNLIDEINSVKFSEGLLNLVIEGRFNYSRFARNQIAFIGITLGIVRCDNEATDRENTGRGNGKVR